MICPSQKIGILLHRGFESGEKTEFLDPDKSDSNDFFDFPKLKSWGSIIPEHAHPNEQIGTVLKGALTLIVGGEEKIVRENDFWCIPADVTHKGKCIEGPAEVLEFFSPPRADYA